MLELLRERILSLRALTETVVRMAIYLRALPGRRWAFISAISFYLPASLRELPVLIVEGPAVGEIGPMDVACRVVAEKAEQVCCPFHLASSAVCPCGCGRRK